MPTAQIHITKKRSVQYDIKSNFALRLAFWNDERVVANIKFINCGVCKKVYGVKTYFGKWRKFSVSE